MQYPGLPLQGAINTALAGSAALTALLAAGASSVFQHVDPDAAKPYVVIGDNQILPLPDQCFDPCEAFPAVHIWTEEKGFEVANAIAAVVCSVLDAALPVTGFAIVTHAITSITLLRQSDNETSHIVVTPHYRLAPTA